MKSATTKATHTMTKNDFATMVAWPVGAVAARLHALGLLVTCGRCLGSGRYSYNQIDGDRCYGCSGSGKALPKLTDKLVADVKARVSAGELEPYLAACRAKAEAKKAIAPLVEEAESIYDTIGSAYTAADRRGEVRKTGDTWSPVFYAQSVNNDLFWGHAVPVRGGEVRESHLARMGVKDIEAAAQWGKVGAVEAVAALRERIAMLVELRAAWLAFCGR